MSFVDSRKKKNESMENEFKKSLFVVLVSSKQSFGLQNVYFIRQLLFLLCRPRFFFFLFFSSMIFGDREDFENFASCSRFIAFFSVRYDDEPCGEMFNVFVRHPGLYN